MDGDARRTARGGGGMIPTRAIRRRGAATCRKTVARSLQRGARGRIAMSIDAKHGSVCRQDEAIGGDRAG